MVLAASRRVLARLLVTAVVILAVSCGDDDSEPTIVVGAGHSVESNLLAHIYAGALARTGAKTSVLAELGGRADYLSALDDGRIGVVGEHSGALLDHFDEAAEARTPDEVNSALSKALPQGLVIADPADGADMRERVLIPAEVAVRDRLTSIAELAPRCGDLTAGAMPVPDLIAPVSVPAAISGCRILRSSLFFDIASWRNALLDGQIQVGIRSGPVAMVARETDGLIALADDDYAVRAQNVLPLLRKGLLDDRRLEKLNYVAGELTAEELVEMIRRVRDGALPGDVARTWLDLHAL